MSLPTPLSALIYTNTIKVRLFSISSLRFLLSQDSGIFFVLNILLSESNQQPVTHCSTPQIHNNGPFSIPINWNHCKRGPPAPILTDSPEGFYGNKGFSNSIQDLVRLSYCRTTIATSIPSPGLDSD